MYSVVMLMAMSGAPETPALFGKRGGCDGGGCHGYAASCGGGDACGCHGGGGRMSRRDRRGCHGGCHGGGGCCGSSSGCGCSGYSSGCGCSGYSSGCGCCGQMASSCGCCGTMSACGGCAGCGGVMMGAPPMQTSPPPAMPPKDGKTGAPTEAMISGTATIVVTLPADARLNIDGVATKQVSGVRQFTTPELAAGQTFFYTLTAEVVRDGQTLTSVQKVAVRAGEQTNVVLPTEQFAQTVAMK
jgi:uncharacterized protein (TIGR03000 family)